MLLDVLPHSARPDKPPLERSEVGRTPREVAALLRVGVDRVRHWINTGQLGAINVSDSRVGKPRYVILPEHLAEFEKSRRVQPPVRVQPRRRPRIGITEYY